MKDWRLPSFNDFLKAQYPQIPSSSVKLSDSRNQREYEDEPEYDNEE